MRVSLLNLGCKVNQAELSEMEGSLRALGHDVVALEDGPEYCIVNTCTVTRRSDGESRNLIRRAGRSGARVIVTGCFSELNREDVLAIEGVEAVLDNSEKQGLIKRFFGEVPQISLPSSGRTRFFLKVQDGCNNSCSYCIVTIARGPSRSEGPERVVEAVNRAVEAGYREVVLSGVHLGHYGADMEPGRSLAWLVRKILRESSIARVRLSSIEVNEVDEELLGLFEEPRVCRHIHIPIQSGDDAVLRAMNRQYDSETLRKTIWDFHDRHPDIAVGTDAIAGFPLETEEGFQNTVRLVEELPFTYMHVFPYSRSPGTAASLMQDIVGDAVRKARAATLRQVATRKKEAYMKAQTGRVLDVIIEEELSNGLYRGTSGNYLKVQAPLRGRACGDIVPIRIEAVRGGVLSGTLESPA